MKAILVLGTWMLLIISRTTFAYNFLYIHPTEGTPIVWDNAQPIQYYLDPGPLGRLSNEQAHTLLKEAMKIWEDASIYANVPHFEFAGYLSEDVDGTNYSKYVSLFQCYTDDLSECISQAQKDLQTVIIFDEDASILLNELCRIGGCSANAGAKVFSGNSANPQNIVQGILVLGHFASSEDTKISAVMGQMVHELGHLLGLAHTLVNQEAIIDEVEDLLNQTPTMSGSGRRSDDTNHTTLNPDDIAGITALYPSETMSQETATIKGQILKSDGSPMMHVNVIAQNVDDPLCEAYSWLSGRSCVQASSILGLTCFAEDDDPIRSQFIISGLPPGTYTIEVEEVASDGLGQTLAPGLLPSEDIYGDAEFWNEGDAANESNTAVTTITLAAGETRENVDIILNRSEVTDNRIQYLPLETFTPGPGTRCPEEPPVDYAELIGVEEEDPADTAGNGDFTGSSSSAGGCSLVREMKVR